MIKTVYFDLGNVLVFFSYEKMLEQTSRCTGLDVDRLKELFFDRSLREIYETGKIDSLELYSTFQSLSKKKFSFEELMHALSDIFSPNLELWPLVERLKKEGIRLVLLSNTSDCHFKKIISDYSILGLFDHFILSYEVGACKPEPLIFQEALAVSNCERHECFYTDDISEFVDSARKEGLDAEIFTGVPALRKHLVERGCRFLLN